MRFLMLVAALLFAPSLVAEQTQPPYQDLLVGLFGYRADGTVGAFAFDSHFQRRSFVYVTKGGCGVGAGMNPSGQQPLYASGQEPFYAWSFSGKVLEITSETAVLQLDWRRVLDAGQPATTPTGTVQLTLQAGDRVLVDSIVPHTTGTPCWSSVGFEARYRANPSTQDSWRLQRIQRPEVHDGMGDGRGVTPAGSASSGGTGSGGSARAAGATAPTAAANTTSYDVHLWLVRSTPGRPEESQYRQLNVAGVHTPFAFAPLFIDTPKGTATVAISGTLDVKGSPEPGHVFLQMQRSVTPPAGASPIPGENSGYVKLQPGADKVMSVEMPPIRLSDQQLPDRLSLRLRVEPR